MTLKPGRFYKSRDGEIWCCFRANPRGEAHCAFDCIRVSDCRIEYFYADGRYNFGGEREHTLTVEVTPEGKML
jgi:hypothetical protein